MSSLEAVLFDMDGTLCDTEPAWMAAEWAIAQRFDAEWTQEDSLKLVGFALQDSGAYIRRRMGLDLTPEEIVDEMIAGVVEWVGNKGVDWRPGALDLVVGCNEAGLPTALVTMSYRALTDVIVDAMPRGRFGAVVVGDEVRRGKPSPDAYLDAAAALGVTPEACIAIEDSPTGVAAAQAAGCLVLAVPNQVALEPGESVRLHDSLADVTVEMLQSLVGER